MVSIPIVLKSKQDVAGAPDPADIVVGEMAWDAVDGKLYGKKTDASVVEIGGGSGAGGALQKAFTLAEDIAAAGTPVALQSDGEIAPITETIGQLYDYATFAPSSSFACRSSHTVYDAAADLWLNIFHSQGTMPYCYAQFLSWNGATFDRSASYISVSTAPYIDALFYNPDVEQVVMIGRSIYSTNRLSAYNINTYGDGTKPVMSSETRLGTISYPKACAAHDTDTNKFLVVAHAGGTPSNLVAFIVENTAAGSFTVSDAIDLGISINAGALGSMDPLIKLCYNTANGKFYLLYSATDEATPAEFKVVPLTINGATVDVGTITALTYTDGAEEDTSYCMDIAADPVNNKVVAAIHTALSASPGTTHNVSTWVMDVDGSGDLTANAQQVLFSNQSYAYRKINLLYDANSAAFFMAYIYRYEVLVVDIELNGLGGVAVGTPQSVGYDTSNYITYNGLYVGKGKDGLYAVAHGVAEKVKGYSPGSQSNIDNFYGFLDEAGLATESKLVNLPGGLDSNQSGLTVRDMVYVNRDGTLTQTASSSNKLVGVAVSADTVALYPDPASQKVQSIFGRTGTIVAEAGDYSASKILNDSTVDGTYVDDALDALDTAVTALDGDLADAESDIADLQTKTECFVVAVSDETTALTTGTGKLTFRMPYALTLTAVRASVNTAPTGAALQVDINEGGTSILSTELTIDDGEKTSTTAATPAVISDSALADDAEITIDIDQVGSTVAGAGLKVYLIGTRP